MTFADKLLQEIQRPILNEDHGVHISASIGICLSDRYGETAELMLRHADVAMYQAKAEGVIAARCLIAHYTHKPNAP